ncbi:MAG: hypothetical protein RJA22_2725 [Verrucomicrobiota bacterium]
MRPDQEDWDLLQAYLETGSEPAFASLVQRHVDQVYSMALRQTRDPHLAQDVTQAVFLVLVRRARSLPAGTILPGWLFTTTRYVAQTVLRTERRRQLREFTAMQEFTETSPEPEALWQELTPHIDEALASLKEKDRHIVLLRFFQHKTVRDVGQALGMSEDAVQKRTTRAVDKLRRYFNTRGITVSAAALLAALSASTATAAPAALAPAIVATASHAGTAAPGVLAAAKGAMPLSAGPLLKPVLATVTALALVPVAALLLQTSTPPDFDLSRDFSLAANPNGPWTYGAKESLAGPLLTSTFRHRTALLEQVWAFAPGQWPGVFQNGGTNVIASAQGRFEPGSLWFAAGEDGSPLHYGAIRLTVPAGAAGRYRVEAHASLGLGGTEASDADFHILHNDTQVYTRVLQLHDRAHYAETLILRDGDTVDLMVGRGPDGVQHGSIVKVHASLTRQR